MSDRKKLEVLFENSGYTDFKWLHPKDIVVAHWVRMKCKFGCSEYGRCAVCPPNMPSVEECKQLFNEYSTLAVFRFTKKVDKPEYRKKWSKKINKNLIELEREVFLAGYHKAFMLLIDSCSLCADCITDKKNCKHPKIARPTPEAMGVSVFDTVRKIGYPIEVLDDYKKEMNRYAILLIE